MENIHMIFHENPSASYTLLKAFRNRRNTFATYREYPIIHASRPGFIVNNKHRKAFDEICDINDPSDYLHVLYPFTLVYPYIMRVLCSKEMPVSMFKVLNTRNSIIMYRRLRTDERLDIDCHNCAPRLVPKGLEIDIKSAVYSGEEKVWENITTYFYPGKFGAADAYYIAPKLDPINDAQVIKGWLEDVVAHCFEPLPIAETTVPMRLDFYLKGPMYYESTLTLENIQTNSGNRFDLYCSGNDKPVISGILHNI